MTSKQPSKAAVETVEDLINTIEAKITSNREKMDQLAQILEKKHTRFSGSTSNEKIAAVRENLPAPRATGLYAVSPRNNPLVKPKRATPRSSDAAGFVQEGKDQGLLQTSPTTVMQTGTKKSSILQEQHSFKTAAKRLNTLATLREKLILQSTHKNSIDNDGWGASLIDVAFVISSVFTCMIVITLWHPLSRFDFRKTPSSYIVLWFVVCGLVSMLWVSLRFFIRVRRGWEIIDEVPLIQRFYLRTWFPFDLFICFPFELMFLGWLNPAFFVLILRHFLRYMRMIDLGNSTNPLLPSRGWFRFTTFLATMCLVAHAVGNIFWSIQHKSDPTLTYVKSLYWSVATMVTVGYGDIVPTADQGRMFAIFSALLGVMIIATFTAASTHFATATDTLTEELNNRKATMYAMMNHYHVPWAVQREVIQIFPAALTNYTEQQFKEHLEVLPKFMQSKLLGYFNAGLLRELPIFQGVAQEVLLQLSAKMSKRYVPQGDFVFEAGEKAEELIFVVHGVIDLVTTRGEELVLVEQLRDGAVLGEEAMTDDDAERLLTAQATSNCEIVVLQRLDFLSVMRNHKDVMQQLHAKSSMRKSVFSLTAAEEAPS